MKNKTLNFTVGPVMSCDEILQIGAQQIPYFRTSEFSELMIDNEILIKKFMNTSIDSKVVFLTGSGTAAMEAAVMNTLSVNDKALIINGGSFGERFKAICEIHEIKYEEILLEYGESLTKECLESYENQGYTSLLINHNETSTGVLYYMEMISAFCKKNKLFLIVDAISSFLSDPYDMNKLGVNVTITASQKALGLAPGISIIALDKKAMERINQNKVKSMYFNLKDYLKDGERGQTPYTPAVGILIQLNKRLKMIDNIGIEKERANIAKIAKDFREKIKELPFEITSKSLSNTVTPLKPLKDISAYEIFKELKDEFNIFVCPNGGELADILFRVGHIGDIKETDNDRLIEALKKIIEKADTMENRIKGKSIDINYDDTLDFFNARGDKNPLKHKYNYVLFQDEHPELAIERDRQEKEKICGIIDFHENEQVLDVGCGVGRWGEEILKRGLQYVGIDYSKGLLDIAKENLQQYEENFILIESPVQNLLSKLKDNNTQKSFDKIFINGVLMYLNDKDIKKCFEDISKIINIENCTIYLKETIAMNERLTLNKFFSEDLKHEYTAIYRTIDEYRELLKEVFVTNLGFIIQYEEDLFSDDLKNRKETKDYYFIIGTKKSFQ